MIFLGRILQVDDRDEYYKTVIGVETGYTTDVYIIRISHNKIERRPAINDQVVFTGVEGRSVDKSIFALESIKFTEYSSCLEFIYFQLLYILLIKKLVLFCSNK